MRSIGKYVDELYIPPLSEREWGYLFLVGERVKIIPEVFNEMFNDLNPELNGKIGVVKDYSTEICSIYGCSYICSVEFDTETITILAANLYRNKRFYDRNIRSKIR
jgi:hypothetical protein